MPRHKQSRRQRAAAAKAAWALKAFQQPVKKDFLADGPARLRAYLWTILVTFGYGLVNDLVLARPERQVNQEALFVCGASMVLHIVLFYSRPTRAKFHFRVTEALWTSIQRLGQQRLGRIVGVCALTFVLVMSALPINAVEPTIAAWALEKSSVGLIPGLDSDLRRTEPAYRFQQVSNRIQKSLSARAPIDPNAVSSVRTRLENVLQNVRLSDSVRQSAAQEIAHLRTYETLSQIALETPQALLGQSSGYIPGVPAVIGAGVDKTEFILGPSAGAWAILERSPMYFSGFTVISFGQAPSAPVSQFVVTKGDMTAVTFNNVKVVGLAQDIGNLTWTNVTFQGSLIRYHGESMRMGNVRFLNCTFERSRDGKGQDLLDFLSTHQGEPVNVYVP